MSCYEQRRRKFLQNSEVAEGYQEMIAEFQLVQAIESVCPKLGRNEEPHFLSGASISNLPPAMPPPKFPR
jgi:hypothetical protein